MPKINGQDALAYFRHAYPHVPLIVLTGYPDTDMAVSCMREGVVDYLVKPVDGKRLKVAVEKQWNNGQWPGGETAFDAPAWRIVSSIETS
jgi:FixJ family two-component response regulator